MRAITLSKNRNTNCELQAKKSYPKAPKGCKSLEEFSDKLEEAILKKI